MKQLRGSWRTIIWSTATLATVLIAAGAHWKH